MPRELPVISACFPFRDISTSLSMQFNEKKITNPASFAKDLLGYLGSARASRATFGVGGNGVVSKGRVAQTVSDWVTYRNDRVVRLKHGLQRDEPSDATPKQA